MNKNLTTQRAQEMSENVWLTLLGRMAQVIGIPLMVLLASWQLGKQDATRDAIDKLGGRVTSLETKVDLTSTDLYHGADANRDFALRDALISANSNRINELNGRVNTLETTHAHRQ